MRLHVVHETHYAYAPAVKTAQHQTHLVPATLPCQRLVSHRLTIDPEPAQRRVFTDGWGNGGCFFSLQASHDQLRVVADQQGVPTAQSNGHTGSTALRLRTAGEVSICEHMNVERRGRLKHPRPLTKRETATYVRQQSQESTVMFLIPVLHVRGRRDNGAQQVGTRQAGSIQHSHEDARGKRGISTND